MKILISSCVLGNKVRWNGSSRPNENIFDWAEEHGYTLVPVCPENELFGTPRKAIRLRQEGDEVKAYAGKQEVSRQLKIKSKEIVERHKDVVGFIGIARSPSCGISAGVKDRGSTIKAYMHQALECPTTEINSMNTEANRQRFLERVKKYEAKYLHDKAVAENEPMYLDPDSKLYVLTSEFLKARGTCCKSVCRHCPWEYKR